MSTMQRWMDRGRRAVNSLDMISSEARLAVYAASLYVTFMLWGFLQERITSARYSPGKGVGDVRWDFPFVLNVCMASATYGIAHLMEMMNKRNTTFPKKLFWRPALAATLASPLGYASFKYINYPLMVLTKSSKPVPIMICGALFFGQTYQWFKYVSVMLLCIGISIFTLAQGNSHASGSAGTSGSSFGILYSLYGVLLILLNLAMDGYTNNEQDRLYKEYALSATQMMKQTNYWQCIFQAAFLLLGAILRGRNSELYCAIVMLCHRPRLLLDISLFCTCATIGQVLIFRLIQEYGSLVWVTISVTRQLFTILLSVMLFGHHVTLVQWCGVLLVFSGLGTDILFTYLSKLKAEHGWNGKMKTLPEALQRSFRELTKVNKDGGGSGVGGSGGARSAAAVPGRVTSPYFAPNNSRNGASGSSSSAVVGLAGRPGAAQRTGSADYVDIEGQGGAWSGEEGPSPRGVGRKSLQRQPSGVDKNKAD